MPAQVVRSPTQRAELPAPQGQYTLFVLKWQGGERSVVRPQRFGLASYIHRVGDYPARCFAFDILFIIGGMCMRRRKRNYADVGSLAKYLRLYYGYSRRRLAEACGLSQVQILAYEHGSRGMSIGNVIKLAGFFGVDPNDLIYDAFEGAVAALPPRSRRNQEIRKRLKQKQKVCDKLGWDGEAYVARLERQSLAGTPYARGVNESYADDLSAGFDIFSFTKDGRPKYIEVKATNGGADEPFYLSRNERQFLNYCFRNNLPYELHRVYHLNDRKRVSREIYTAEELENGFEFSISEYAVRKEV